MALIGSSSSVGLIAGAGILGNVGGVPITANSAVITAINDYNSIPVVAQFANVTINASNVLSSNAQIELNNLAANVFPALTDAVPTAYISNIGNTPTGGFVPYIANGISNIMGSGDLGKFEQVFNLADSFRVTSNQMINSVVNADNASANATYVSQDATITGGISQISLAFRALGQDLNALGYAIDLGNLTNIGSPEALLRQIYTRSNGLPELTTALTQAGIEQFIINNIGSINLTDEQQKIVFEVMTKITRVPLVQILRLLRVTTRGLTNLADLLNPVKALPNSFNTLTAPTASGPRSVYINSTGAINSKLETELPTNVLVPAGGYATTRNTYSQLKKIIPPDWALANKALQAGLQEVKSIFNTSLPSLSSATVGLESNKGLDLINALTSPLPPEVVNFYKNSFVSGTGLNGTVLLADIIGSAGGWVVTGNIAVASNVLTSLTASNALNTLTNNSNGVFTIMQNTIDGDYDVYDPPVSPESPPIFLYIQIPGGLPGAGTYGSYDLAFTGPGSPGTGLIPAANSLIGTIVANNTNAVANANSAWSNIGAQISNQTVLQAQASIDFANLIPGQKAMSLVNNLGSFGLDTEVGGPAWFFEAVANTSTLGGQAIVSTMREARNQFRLQTAGLQTEIIVSDVVVSPQATLSSGQYTAQEAASQKIV